MVTPARSVDTADEFIAAAADSGEQQAPCETAGVAAAGTAG
jgi:hypothetical protein